MEKILDYKNILKSTPNKKELKVTLKSSKRKGVGLYAVKDINKGEIIAYYKIKVFRKKDYISPTDYVYCFEVYRKNGKEYKRLIGDIDEDSFPQPLNGVPFWGPFSNEPSMGERSNSEIEIELDTNYKDRNYSVPGDHMIYSLIAKRKIRKGDEILWYYGDGYDRDYKASKR